MGHNPDEPSGELVLSMNGIRTEDANLFDETHSQRFQADADGSSYIASWGNHGAAVDYKSSFCAHSGIYH